MKLVFFKSNLKLSTLFVVSNCLKPKTTGYKQLSKSISTSTIVRNKKTNIDEEKKVDEIKAQDYERLWLEQDANLRTKFTQDEFKFVIDRLYNLVRKLKNTPSHNDMALSTTIYQKIAQPFLYPELAISSDEHTMSSGINTSLLTKLKQPNGENWSILFDNIPRVVSFVDELDQMKVWHAPAPHKSFAVDEIKKSMHIDLFQNFSRIQFMAITSKGSFELISEIKPNSIDLERLQLNTDIVAALYEYSKLHKPKLSKSVMILKPVIQVHLLYINTYLLMNRKTLRSCDPSIEPYQNQVGKLVRLLMTHYENIDSIHEKFLDEYFWFFSFDHKLWFSSSQWLLQGRSKIPKTFEKLYTPAIRGAIRFEDMKTFDALYKDLLRIRKLANTETLHIDEKIARDYLNVCYGKSIRKETNGDEVNHLLSTWNTMFILPNTSMVTNLAEFIRVDHKSQWRMQDVTVNNEGRCLSTNDRLPKVEFNPNEIANVADKFMQNISSTDYLDSIKSIQVDDLERMKILLSNNKFDFVVDGMNVGYMTNSTFEEFKLDSVLYMLQKEATLANRRFNVLIVLREHVLKRSSRSHYESLLKQYDGKSSRIRLNLFFAYSRLKDDHFSLYAALKSGPETRIVTNDFFTNQWQTLGEHGVLFRRWIIHRRVMIHMKLQRLEFPPAFEMRVARLVPQSSPTAEHTRNRWIIPYFVGDETINYNFKFFKFYICEQINDK